LSNLVCKSMSSRQRILETALKLFNQEGYSQVSINKIRAVAQVSNGSFFHAFKTKEELASEIYLDSLSSYHQGILQAIEHSPGPENGIGLVLSAHFSWVEDERSRAQFLFNHSQSAWMNKIKSEQEEENQLFFATFSQWLEGLINQSKVKDLPVEIFIAQLIGPSQILCRAWLSGKAIANPSIYKDRMINLAIEALL